MKFPICEKEIDYSVSTQVSRDYGSSNNIIKVQLSNRY